MRPKKMYWIMFPSISFILLYVDQHDNLTNLFIKPLIFLLHKVFKCVKGLCIYRCTCMKGLSCLLPNALMGPEYIVPILPSDCLVYGLKGNKWIFLFFIPVFSFLDQYYTNTSTGVVHLQYTYWSVTIGAWSGAIGGVPIGSTTISYW